MAMTLALRDAADVNVGVAAFVARAVSRPPPTQEQTFIQHTQALYIYTYIYICLRVWLISNNLHILLSHTIFKIKLC